MIKAILIPLHIFNPIRIKQTLKGTSQDNHTQGNTQAIVPSIVVEEMVVTQPIVVDLNARCLAKLDIHHWIAGITLIRSSAISVVHVSYDVQPLHCICPN